MSKLIIYIGLIGTVISVFTIVIPRNVVTNGADIPLYIKVSFLVFAVSILVTLIAVLTLKLGEILFM